jgi:FkbH-like protein
VVGHYHEVTPLPVFSEALSAELDAMYRTMLQTSSVKLVVVDLDDTLWNGVVADMEDPGADLLEGWAFGIVEALQCVRRRGILLAIISKNDEAGIRAIWKTIFAGRLLLEDFCAVRINWRPKPENMAEILQAVSLLPRNVVFIDDNPAERARMQEVFPDMRLLGRHPLTIRRVLLQAPETQTVRKQEPSYRWRLSCVTRMSG